MLAVRMTLDARSQMRCAIFVACSTEQHPMMIARIVVFTVARPPGTAWHLDGKGRPDGEPGRGDQIRNAPNQGATVDTTANDACLAAAQNAAQPTCRCA